MWIWLLLGLVLGIAFIALARALGERRILAVGLIVAAVIYVGFAAAAGAPWRWLGVEAMGVVLYGALALLGLRHSRGWLVLGWGFHPVWDVALHITGAGQAFAPAWYAILCISFDVVVALYIASQWRRSGSDKPKPLRGAT